MQARNSRRLSLDARFSMLTTSEGAGEEGMFFSRKDRRGSGSPVKRRMSRTDNQLSKETRESTSESPTRSTDSTERHDNAGRAVRRRNSGACLQDGFVHRRGRSQSEQLDMPEEVLRSLRRGRRRSSALLGEDVRQVMFSLSYLPSPGQLTVTIIKARNIVPKSHLLSPPDSYVKVALMCESKKIDRKKTGVITGTTDPIFNESFLFDVAEVDMKGVFLSLVVQDTSGTSLGGSEVGPWSEQWNEMLENPRKPVTSWCTLKDVTSDTRRGSEDVQS
ncbi:SYT9 [Branchiostoma lanceolatum]|uniref:SYT9 protein n=2 Tax=Branchiostoma lanceolatum TaxID=7740 RepID=A0A8J9VAM7_BRALA|nr:SYT9 [Branchiostoma lanceolatum]